MPHQQIYRAQCIIGCEKRRGQLIHPIVGFTVAIETNADGNTTKKKETRKWFVHFRQDVNKSKTWVGKGWNMFGPVISVRQVLCHLYIQITVFVNTPKSCEKWYSPISCEVCDPDWKRRKRDRRKNRRGWHLFAKTKIRKKEKIYKWDQSSGRNRETHKGLCAGWTDRGISDGQIEVFRICFLCWMTQHTSDVLQKHFSSACRLLSPCVAKLLGRKLHEDVNLNQQSPEHIIIWTSSPWIWL